MHAHTSHIINFFADAPIQFVEAYEQSITAQHSSTQCYTAPDSNSLIITVKGSAYFVVNEEQIKLDTSHVLHTTAKTKLSIQPCGNADYSYIIVNYRLPVEEIASYSLYSQSYTLGIGRSEELLHILRSLIDHYHQPTQITKLQLKSLFYHFIQHMLQAAQQGTSMTKSELMLKAVEYMHDSFNKPISVTQVSEQFGIERRRFAYLFERYTGMTPNHYLTSFRMKRSRELLRANHYTVAEVAELVGYQDSFYFSRVFKKYNGLSPSDYRKKLHP